jgi:alkanesulfonate monooxygenase SsuD/methylene tetrahydromethanopterin reductase-like flavin-dependent oxidoreductase (luciferase family)
MNTGFGVSAMIAPELIAPLATAAEEHGYGTFWVNDVPGGNGLEQLARAQAATSTIELGVGVLPVDRWSAEQVGQEVTANGLDTSRLILGIGAGNVQRGSIEAVRSLAEALPGTTGARVFIGALGPKMCALAGEVSDGVLLNWLTPAAAHELGRHTIDASVRAGRKRPGIYAYVRTAAASAAKDRLEREASSYEGYPSYKRHFDRMGVRAIETAINGNDSEIRERYHSFAGIADEVVCRAIVANETLDDYMGVLRAARPVPSD